MRLPKTRVLPSTLWPAANAVAMAASAVVATLTEFFHFSPAMELST